MPQAQIPNPRPMANITQDGQRDVLPEGVRIERRVDGSVWRIEKLIKPTAAEGKPQVGPDYAEQRIDSRQDADMIARGEQPWYMKHLRKAKS